MPPTRAASPPDQAERLRAAAARCFARKGFRGTTVDDIAAEAGLSRPILYKHYEGKDGLIDAVLDELLSEWARASQHPGDGTAAEQLRGKLERSIAFAMERPLLQAIFQQDPRVLIGGHVELFRHTNEASRAEIERLVRTGQAAGEFATDLDPVRTTDYIVLVENTLAQRALGRDGGSIDARDLAESLRILMRGLRPTPSSEAD